MFDNILEIEKELEGMETGRLAFWTDNARIAYLRNMREAVLNPKGDKLPMRNTDELLKRIDALLNKVLTGQQ